MKSNKIAAKKIQKLELAKETVRSLQVKSDVRAGIYQIGNGGAGGVRSTPGFPTQHGLCN